MEKEKPEFIPYFHSSQGPAEAPEPMKSGLSVQGRLWEGSIHLLWVPGLDYLPRGPVGQNRFQFPTTNQSPSREDSGPWTSASRPLRP